MATPIHQTERKIKKYSAILSKLIKDTLSKGIPYGGHMGVSQLPTETIQITKQAFNCLNTHLLSLKASLALSNLLLTVPIF